MMNATWYSVRTGIDRGVHEFRLMLTNPPDMLFYVVMASLILGVTYANRDEDLPGTSLTYATVAMPGVLGGLVGFLAMVGSAFALASEREDGTLLRARAMPHGMTGYVTGQVVRSSLETVFGVAFVLVPALFLFDGLMQGGLGGWLTFAWVVLLGLLATLPLGIILGSLVRGSRGVSTWAMLPIVGLIMVSGIFFPLSVLPGWVQVLSQVFPLYWLGLGMRSAFLPDAAAVAEIGASWRTLETVGVLGAWAVVGLIAAPIVLRRMARRESGSVMEARRQQALQRIS